MTVGDKDIKTRKKRGEQFNEAAGHSTRGVTSAFTPSGIEADHSTNMRWLAHDTMPELVPYLGPKCCFSAEQIEGRLRSLKTDGQIEPVEVFASATGQATLKIGFLRHAGFLLAEVRGELDSIPGARGKIVAIETKQPKSAEDWAALADRNLAENRERAALSDTDLAFYVERRLPQYVRELRKADEALTEKAATKLAIDKIAEKLGMSTRNVQRYRQLAQSKPTTLLAVHTGALTMTAALRTASEKGEGPAKGPLAGVRHSSIRRALAHVTTRPVPPKSLAPAEVLTLARILAGETVDDELSDAVREWSDWLDAPKDLGKPAPAPSQTAAADTKQAPAARRPRKSKPVAAKDES